jgi:hypothetical protein
MQMQFRSTSYNLQRKKTRIKGIHRVKNVFYLDSCRIGTWGSYVGSFLNGQLLPLEEKDAKKLLTELMITIPESLIYSY